MSAAITQERLKELFNYDANTGLFIWKVEPNKNGKIKIGDLAGGADEYGYIVISVDGKKYKRSRLAILYVTGNLPSKFADHIDGVVTNDRIDNLRNVTNKENQHNQRVPSKNNTTGYLGVSLIKSSGKYRSAIRVNGKITTLGHYTNPKDAHQAYLEAKRVMHPTGTI